MKLETLAARIALKAGAPVLEECLLYGQIPENLECMIWTGKKTREGIFPRLIRDSEGRPGYEPAVHKAAPLIQYKKKNHYVNRLVFTMTTGVDLDGVRLRSICGEGLCINPNHWVASKPPQQDQEEEAPQISEDWTLGEALELLEIYLETNQTIDPEHALLIDIPAELLEEATTHIRGG